MMRDLTKRQAADNDKNDTMMAKEKKKQIQQKVMSHVRAIHNK